MYAFFDGVAVDQHIIPTGGRLGGIITSNDAGVVAGTFSLPAGTFNTGTRELKFQDSPTGDAVAIPGALVSSATANFRAEGLRNTFRDTITNTTTEIRNTVIERTRQEVRTNFVNNVTFDPAPPAPVVPVEIWNGESAGGMGDPLAETFFTYGITGGCYITKFDLFFQSKDNSIPVTLEIRDVVNGYPGPRLVHPDAKVSLSPSQVATSNNASAVTTFTFSRPIYLREDGEFCFVLLANSNNYNMWTSEFGTKSIETGKTIFEQPFIGTLFKSENNKTWTAEQTQDIKFTMYKAKFDTAEKSITFKATAPEVLIQGHNMSVTSGASLVTVVLPFQHGNISTDKIYLRSLPTSVYRGVTQAVMNAVAGYPITVVNKYSFTFSVSANFTSTGKLGSSGYVNRIDVDAGGSGYNNGTYTATITAPPSGTTATADVIISSGSVRSVIITNPGTGYVTTPVVTFSAGAGSGAVITAISEAIFASSLNRPFQLAQPMIFSEQPSGTRLVTTLKTASNASGAYVIAPISSTHDINVFENMDKEAVLMSASSEVDKISGATSTELIIRLNSDNPNVSPVIDLGQVAVLRTHNIVINEYTDARNTSELANSGGTAQARYISKMISLDSASKGVRVHVNASSTATTSFDVFIRTSLASNGTHHRKFGWAKLNCDTPRNASSTIADFLDYEFYLDDIPLFDIYDLKIVKYSPSKYLFPIIANYRSIILAT